MSDGWSMAVIGLSGGNRMVVTAGRSGLLRALRATEKRISPQRNILSHSVHSALLSLLESE